MMYNWTEMAGLKELTYVWTNIKEVDLRPLLAQAQRSLKIALVGRRMDSLNSLAFQMRRDPMRPSQTTSTPLLLLSLEDSTAADSADLVILVLEGPLAGSAGQLPVDDSAEWKLARGWANSGKKVLVVIDMPSPDRARELEAGGALSRWSDWGKQRVVDGSVEDTHFLLHAFAPAVMDLLPEALLSLGRSFPLFRVPIARQLIGEACTSNAAYALSTGIAEIVPVFDIPLNVADMIILTKTQAFLVYKLGLALGLSTRWHDYLTEFGGVLGGGFLWRQVARSLVGLIPAWGVLPKVAVSYAGTYVVGNVVLRWYLTGKHISGKQMRQLYMQAFARGKNLARDLLARLPRPGRRARKALPAPSADRVCPNCGLYSAIDALYCRYCGQPLGR